ncbi:MAG: hypothetical protein AAF519_03545 [Bacteroidota bacterium]
MMKKPSLLVLICILSNSLWSQNPWNKKRNEGFFKLDQTFIISDSFYTPEKDISDITTTGVYISSLYGEFGISNKVTGVFYFPFFFRSTLNELEFSQSGVVEPGDELNSVGDATIGLQYQVLKKGRFSLSSSLVFGIPLGEDMGGRTQLLQSGDGEFNQLLRLHGGYSFYPKPAYLAIGVGFNNRTRGFSDEFHLSVEAGYTVGEKLNLAIKLYNLSSFQNGSTSESQTGLFSNNLEFLSIGPEISYNLHENFGVTGAVFGAFSGRNILASPSFSAGLFYTL